mgnify:CR=1 FL=1
MVSGETDIRSGSLGKPVRKYGQRDRKIEHPRATTPRHNEIIKKRSK